MYWKALYLLVYVFVSNNEYNGTFRIFETNKDATDYF